MPDTPGTRPICSRLVRERGDERESEREWVRESEREMESERKRGALFRSQQFAWNTLARISFEWLSDLGHPVVPSRQIEFRRIPSRPNDLGEILVEDLQ